MRIWIIEAQIQAGPYEKNTMIVLNKHIKLQHFFLNLE